MCAVLHRTVKLLRSVAPGPVPWRPFALVHSAHSLAQSRWWEPKLAVARKNIGLNCTGPSNAARLWWLCRSVRSAKRPPGLVLMQMWQRCVQFCCRCDQREQPSPGEDVLQHR
jgi:hypothetical protein